jgi:hypothetical protein
MTPLTIKIKVKQCDTTVNNSKKENSDIPTCVKLSSLGTGSGSPSASK